MSSEDSVHPVMEKGALKEVLLELLDEIPAIREGKRSKAINHIGSRTIGHGKVVPSFEASRNETFVEVHGNRSC